MKSFGPARTYCLRFRVGPDSASCINHPYFCCIVCLSFTCPPVFRLGGGKINRIQGWVEMVVIIEAEQLNTYREAPVGQVCQCQIAAKSLSVFPGHLASVGFLPHQSRNVIGDRSIPVVGKRGRIDDEIRILSIGGSITVGLSGIRKPERQVLLRIQL